MKHIVIVFTVIIWHPSNNKNLRRSNKVWHTWVWKVKGSFPIIFLFDYISFLTFEKIIWTSFFYFGSFCTSSRSSSHQVWSEQLFPGKAFEIMVTSFRLPFFGALYPPYWPAPVAQKLTLLFMRLLGVRTSIWLLR